MDEIVFEFVIGLFGLLFLIIQTLTHYILFNDNKFINTKLFPIWDSKINLFLGVLPEWIKFLIWMAPLFPAVLGMSISIYQIILNVKHK